MMPLDQYRESLDRIAFIMLCLAALTFPFSVAACNIALTASLASGLLGGSYILGARYLWKHFRIMTVAWLAYLALFPVGLLWSLDVDRGLQIIGRQWFWLLIPLAVHILRTPFRRNRFLLILSLGLILHMLFCLAQFFGLVDLGNKAGSSQLNPTGFIGHTSFGLVYGIWATFLLHWSTFMQGWRQWGTRLIALWGIGMIFLSSGRGGYLVVASLLLILIWKMFRARPMVKLASVLLLILCIVLVLSIGPGKERVAATWNSLQAVKSGIYHNPEPRWSLWYVAILGWQQHMPMGTGTGGYHVAAASIHKQLPDLFDGGPFAAHPHNMLLQALNRWGPLGVLLLAAVYIIWIREGWRSSWHADPASCLVTLTGVAMFVQGMTEPSFEEHFPGILTTMLLGAGLTTLTQSEVSNPHEDNQNKT